MAQSKSKSAATKEYNYGDDEITMNLSIPSFKKLYDAAKTEKKSEILAEEFIVGKKNWALELKQNKEEDVGLYISFNGTNCVSAEYYVYLKSSEGKFISTRSFGLHKYAPVVSNGASQAWGMACWKSLSQLQNEGFLSDGTLQLKLILTVYSGNALLRMEAMKDLKKGLKSEVGADVTFIFLEEEGSKNVIGKIKAIRGILSLRSPVFATMFASGMKEAAQGEVKISDMTPKSFGILLKFLYSGEIDAEWGSFAAELIYAADKYDLKALQNYLCKNIASVLTAKNVWKIRSLASLHKLPQILKATMKFIKENTEDFVETIRDITFK